MDGGLLAKVQMLCDRQSIRDAITAYCRGVDRLDRALVLTAYHSDAIDDHGMFVGGPAEFVDWAFALHAAEHSSHQHIVTNHHCELDGGIAHTETYWMVAAIQRDDGRLTLSGGRYVDRFEQREGRWAIAARKCVPDWRGVPGPTWLSPEALAALASGGLAARNPADCSYERPLIIDDSRLGFRFGNS